MADPFSALGIAAFAFANHFVQTEVGKKFIESIVGKLGEKTLEAGLSLISQLKAKLREKFGDNADVQAAIAAAETGDQQALKTLSADLQVVMGEDDAFAAEIKQIAQQIINIGQIEGKNIQTIYGGQGLQVNDPQSQVIQTGDNAKFYFGTKED